MSTLNCMLSRVELKKFYNHRDSCLFMGAIYPRLRLDTGYNVGWFLWSTFCIFEIISFCFAVLILDLVHDAGRLCKVAIRHNTS